MFARSTRAGPRGSYMQVQIIAWGPNTMLDTYSMPAVQLRFACSCLPLEDITQIRELGASE